MSQFLEFYSVGEDIKISLLASSITGFRSRVGMPGSVICSGQQLSIVAKSYEEVKAAIDAWYANNSPKEQLDQNQDGEWVPYTVNSGDGALEERRIWMPGVANKNQEFVIVKVISPEQKEPHTP